MTEGLRIVAKKRAGGWIDLFGKQAECIGSCAQRLVQFQGLLDSSLFGPIIDEPKTAQEEGPFMSCQSIRRYLHPIAIQQAVAGAQTADYRLGCRHHTGMVGRNDPADGERQQTGVDASSVEMFRE